MKNDFLESFIFHPRKAYQQKGENDHLIEVEKGINVGARFHLNNPAAPTILFFHGNGEIAPEKSISSLPISGATDFQMALPLPKIHRGMPTPFWIMSSGI